MATGQALQALEFSRVIDVAALNGKRTEMTLEASEGECAALARRFGVDAIAGLSAELVLTPFSSGNKVALKARFGANVEQACVVTLKPLTTRVGGDFVAEFVPPAFIEESAEVEFEAGEDDPPEPIVDGKIEVGELVAQHLGLAIDPFPRAAGAEFPGLQVGEAGSDGADAGASPFAVLKKLKSSKG